MHWPPGLLLLLPIALPMFTAAVMLLLGERRRRAKAVLNIGASLAGLAVAVLLLVQVDAGGDARAQLQVYLAGNWRAPFGIVLVADRLSALMLVLSALLGVAAAVHSSARWDQAGVHFHPLVQLQLMGLNGAFLTGDLFNLFVFFEIMLAASYGLLLHGSGRPRVMSGLHYIAINLAASSLFLVGASMLYGVTGTLNLADMAQRVAQMATVEMGGPHRGLMHAGAAILGVAFLVKAAVWPLNFWLVPAYSAATAPVGALFAILTKVGVYAVLRVWTLLFDGNTAGVGWGSEWLLAAGLLGIACGAIGMLGSQRLGPLAGYGVVVSSGTLLAAISFGQPALTGAALYYLLGSTLAACTLLLLGDVVERWRNGGAALAAHEQGGRAPFLTHDLQPLVGVNLDDDGQELAGRAIPAAAAFLGLVFLCCTLLIAGIPPLPGFLGKFAMLDAALNPMQPGNSGAAVRPAAWALLGMLIVSGFLALVSMSRAGIRHFWTPLNRPAPALRLAEALPLAGLLIAFGLLTVQAGAVMRYTRDAAQALHSTKPYIDAVLGTRPVRAKKESP